MKWIKWSKIRNLLLALGFSVTATIFCFSLGTGIVICVAAVAIAVVSKRRKETPEEAAIIETRCGDVGL